MPKQYAVGVDVGGTKILAAVVDVHAGQVVSSARKRTRPDKGSDFFVERLLGLVQSAIDDAKLPDHEQLAGIGVGIAGQVDREKGVLLASPNLGVGFEN